MEGRPGCLRIVSPPNFASGSPWSKWVAKYRAATGNIIVKQGEKGSDADGRGNLRMMTLQMADVTKPLASVGRITSKHSRMRVSH